MVTWALITLIGAAAVFVEERLGGTLRRLASDAHQQGQRFSAARCWAGWLRGLLQMALLIGFGALVFDVQWGRRRWRWLPICLSFALAAVAFGVMLGTFAKTRSQAGWLVILFSMLTAALGGCWWPLEITPPIYQTVVKILPTTWAMQGFNNVLVRGAGLEVVCRRWACCCCSPSSSSSWGSGGSGSSEGGSSAPKHKSALSRKMASFGRARHAPVASRLPRCGLLAGLSEDGY